MSFPMDARDRFLTLVCFERWTLEAALAAVGASKATGTRWWAQSSGMTLRAPRAGGGLADPPPMPDVRKGPALTQDDRINIEIGVRMGWSMREIGAFIGRDRSVVWREIDRNRGPDGSYSAAVAHVHAHQRRRRPKQFKLLERPVLCRQIEAWMDEGWSPRLIATMLAIEFPDDETMRVSHETIYQALYVQSRGQLRKDLARQLSTKRAKRKPRGSVDGRGTAIYQDAFTISDRPPEVADRAVPGHWEGDLIIGSGSSAIGTLVERRTRFTILLHLPNTHTADEVAGQMIKQMAKLPEHLRRSITWDRGSELAAYERIQFELATTVFFADPHSPWQRGTNENTNRLLRHWFEKGSDLRAWDAAGLRRVQDTLNSRPRPTLELKTPAQALNELLDRAADNPNVATTT